MDIKGIPKNTKNWIHSIIVVCRNMPGTTFSNNVCYFYISVVKKYSIIIIFVNLQINEGILNRLLVDSLIVCVFINKNNNT